MDFSLTLFGVLYVITFIIPGLLFKRFYYQGKFSKQFHEGLFTDRLLTYILWGITIQLLTITFYCLFFDIKAIRLYEELKNGYTSYKNKEIPAFQFNYIVHLIRYIIATIIFATALGTVLHIFIRFMKWDINFSLFRFSNIWHYYFSGESLKFKEFRKNSLNKNIKVISTDVDIVVKNDDGKSNMFSGTLSQYTLSRNGELELIYLTNTHRFSNSATPPILKPIPGDCFIIPYKNVLNLNIRYNIAIKNNHPFGLIKQVIIYIINIFSILFLFLALIYPWFVASTFWYKLLSSILLFLSWFNYFSFILSVTAKDKKEAPIKNKSSLVIIIIITLLLLLLGLVSAGKISFNTIYNDYLIKIRFTSPSPQ